MWFSSSTWHGALCASDLNYAGAFVPAAPSLLNMYAEDSGVLASAYSKLASRTRLLEETDAVAFPLGHQQAGGQGAGLLP